MTKRPAEGRMIALANDGLNNDQIAAALGVSVRSIQRWRTAAAGVNEGIKAVRASLRQAYLQPCGTKAAYRRGCRCGPCTTANRDRCYETAMRRRRRAGLPSPDQRIGRRRGPVALGRKAAPAAVVPTPDRIAQAIARGETNSQIMADLGISYETVRDARAALDEAVAR